MQIRTEGIVIKESSSGENDKYITILTAEHGTVEAYVKGARRKGSRLATSTGLFVIRPLSFLKITRDITLTKQILTSFFTIFGLIYRD